MGQSRQIRVESFFFHELMMIQVIDIQGFVGRAGAIHRHPTNLMAGRSKYNHYKNLTR
jgi:hypothetical protein